MKPEKVAKVASNIPSSMGITEPHLVTNPPIRR